MKNLAIKVLIVSTAILSLSSFSAEEINYARAKFNYQMFCQGCHTPDGTGGNNTPKIKGHIGHFLSTQQGREYLVRVPGSANSTLDNPQLAELLNWIVLELGGESTPVAMKHYTASEVEELRKEPLFEVTEYRKQLVSELSIKRE